MEGVQEGQRDIDLGGEEGREDTAAVPEGGAD